MVTIVAPIVSILPAALSYKLIESRKSRNVVHDLYSFSVLISLTCLVIISSLVHYRLANSGLGLSGIESKDDAFSAQIGNDCGAYQVEFETRCRVGPNDSPFLVMLFGDSHAQAASTGVADAVARLGGSLIVASGGGCPFLQLRITEKCDEFNGLRLASILKERPTLVIIVNHPTSYIDKRLNDGFEKNFTRDQLMSGLDRLLELLNAEGVPAIVQGEIPVCDFHVNLISKYSLKRRFCLKNFNEQLLHLDFLGRTQKLVEKFDLNLFFDPRPKVCPKPRCAPFLNGKMIFADVSHLSPTGSRMLTPLYIEAIKQVLEQK